MVAIGQHHALCLEEGGAVYSLVRQEYSEGGADATVPCFAVTADGDYYSWGMGTNG